jgi:hypothetical protein
MKKNDQRKYKYLFLGRGKSYYKHSDSARKFYETVIINMVEFLIDNIFDMFDGRVLQQRSAFHGYKLCSSSRLGLFIYSYKPDFIQGLLNENERKITLSIL